MADFTSNRQLPPSTITKPHSTSRTPERLPQKQNASKPPSHIPETKDKPQSRAEYIPSPPVPRGNFHLLQLLQPSLTPSHFQHFPPRRKAPENAKEKDQASLFKPLNAHVSSIGNPGDQATVAQAVAAAKGYGFDHMNQWQTPRPAANRKSRPGELVCKTTNKRKADSSGNLHQWAWRRNKQHGPNQSADMRLL